MKDKEPHISGAIINLDCKVGSLLEAHFFVCDKVNYSACECKVGSTVHLQQY